jgi:hypothetical protein
MKQQHIILLILALVAVATAVEIHQEAKRQDDGYVENLELFLN